MSTTEKQNCPYCGGETNLATTMDLPVPNKYFATYDAAITTEYRTHELMRCNECGSFSLKKPPFTPEELFAGDYAFTPLSRSWHNHCVELARAIKAELPENAENNRGVIYDIGGNDGALSSVMYRICDRLTIVIDPSDVAPFQDGIHWPKRKGFFGEAFARQLLREGERLADAITATNVLAHVPDPLDFMRGVKALLAPEGVAVFEFPDGEIFGEKVLFDLTYAEHLGYITLKGIRALAERAGLSVDAAIYSEVHGGSWRALIRHGEPRKWFRLREPVSPPDFQSVMTLRLEGLRKKLDGKKIIGFGSAAKSVVVNALIAFEAVPQFIIDETPAKVGKFQPGSGAKILPLPKTYVEAMSEDEKLAHELLTTAEICINYAWNYPDEVRDKLARAGFRGEIVTVHDF